VANSENLGTVVNVFIADASLLICELMSAALVRSRYRFSVVGYSTDLGNCRTVIDKSEAKVDVAVISSNLKEGPLAGFQLAKDLRLSQAHVKIIALLDSCERTLVVEAFRSGANGILSQEQPFELLCKCIHAVSQGQVWASGKEMQYALDALAANDEFSDTKLNKGRVVLTKREEGIVRLVSAGLTNRDISQQLKLSENTVRNYLFRIFNKTLRANIGETSLVPLINEQGEKEKGRYEFSWCCSFPWGFGCRGTERRRAKRAAA